MVTEGDVATPVGDIKARGGFWIVADLLYALILYTVQMPIYKIRADSNHGKGLKCRWGVVKRGDLGARRPNTALPMIGIS